MNFKLDQGTTLDLRIFSIVYYLTFLISYEQNKKYNSNLNMTVFSLK